MKPFSGGRTIVQGIFYAENGTYTRYSGYDTINIAPSDVITAAEFDIKQSAVAVSISGLEMLQNAGPEAVFDLLEERINNAEMTMANNMSSDAYSDGTANGGKQIGGLQLLVADTGLSTAGGISSTTYTFWRNYVYDFSNEGPTPSATTIQAAMNKTYLSVLRGPDRPDLWVGDNVYFTYYWSSLQTIQRITNDSLGAAGFANLKFMDADVVADGGFAGPPAAGHTMAPASHLYALNTKYLFLRPHRQRNMVPLDPDRFSVNQDAMVKMIAWAGNMTCSNRALQGVIVA